MRRGIRSQELGDGKTRGLMSVSRQAWAMYGKTPFERDHSTIALVYIR